MSAKSGGSMRLEDLILTYSKSMKAIHGCKVFRVGLSTGVRCPHRAVGGCIFCNPASFRGQYQTENNSIEKQLATGKQIIKANSKAKKFIAYFQDETSTAGDAEMLKAMFEQAASDPEIVELVISTRPDYIDEHTFELFKNIKIPVKLEIGLQSIHDHSLNFLRRGHSFADSERAITLCGKHGISVGVHLIMGICGESFAEMKETIDWITGRKEIMEIKFHNLVIYEGTELAEMWKRQEVKQMPINDYIEILSELLPYVREDIVISRLFTSNILHNDLALVIMEGNKTKWMNRLRLKLEEKKYQQGCKNI